MMKRAFGTTQFGILIMLLATSCSKDIPIVEPTYNRVSNETVRIEVNFDPADAEFIRNEEVYLTLTAHECGSSANRYPADALVGQSKVSEFDFPITGDRVTIHGDIPIEVFNRYERPCLILEGGGYSGRSVSSKSTPIKPKAL